MLLSQLRSVLLKQEILFEREQDILAITSDSRQVRPGSLFIAIRGYTVDGHRFVKAAADAGACAALVEEPIEDAEIPQVIVPDTRRASAIIADYFYGHPSQQLKMIGVTGTNGKTTVTHLIEQVLHKAGYTTGLLGTIGKRIAGETSEVVNTTPEAVELQSTLAEMAEKHCDYGVMEVSSHALELGRVAGVRYHIAVHTNLTQDHLDFHGTMDNYRAAKGKLFARLGNTFGDSKADMSYGVLNADDSACRYFSEQIIGEYVTYGIQEAADVRAQDVVVNANGVHFRVETFAGNAEVQLQLTGRFNVYNSLAAIAVGLIEEIPLQDIVEALEAVEGIPGRLERVAADVDYTVLVDYSHTADSLENALLTVREFVSHRVITVVGCGGDRDKGKRPVMAQVAAKYSDRVILTSDNPRTEDPDQILDDMEAGVKGAANVTRITDRKTAIEQAIVSAGAGDIILIAGKGHETYQIVGRTKHHFDDREVAREAMSKLHN